MAAHGAASFGVFSWMSLDNGQSENMEKLRMIFLLGHFQSTWSDVNVTKEDMQGKNTCLMAPGIDHSWWPWDPGMASV